jgi:hypothetical protein
MTEHTLLCLVPTRDKVAVEALAPKLRPFLVDQSADDDSFLICAPSLADAHAVVRERRRAKLLLGAGPRIVAVPMKPLDGEP